MAERFAVFFQKIAQGRHVITADTIQQIDQGLASMDSIKDEGLRKVTEGFERFLKDLYGINGVDGVGFLAITQPHVPLTIYSEVVMKLTPADEIRESYRAVAEADGRLAELTRKIIPMGIGFVNSSGRNLDSLEAKLRERWSQEPDSELLAFVKFQRE